MQRDPGSIPGVQRAFNKVLFARPEWRLFMDEATREKIFAAQTKNVRKLEKAWVHLKRIINQLIYQNDESGLSIHTKFQALTYSAYAESLFIKLIHTPHTFTLDEISQVKQKGNNNIIEGWKKCLELALKRVDAGQKSNHIHNVRKKVLDLINAYVLDPSLIRNKIAHGQWVEALNNKMTNTNPDTTLRLEKIDPIKLEVNMSVFIGLYSIIEDIVTSPNKAHIRDYWSTLVNLETDLAKKRKWSLEARRELLLRKKPKLK